MDTFIYLKSDMSRIMFNDMPYTKYRDENQKGEKTWRCSQAGCCVTIKTCAYACAYISLLSNGQDPSQHTFDQRLLRLSFRRFLEGDDIPYFCPINAKSQIEITTVEIDWGFKYEEKYADLIEQYRKNLSKDTGKEPFITL
jgi:hypothetical protein